MYKEKSLSILEYNFWEWKKQGNQKEKLRIFTCWHISNPNIKQQIKHIQLCVDQRFLLLCTIT